MDFEEESFFQVAEQMLEEITKEKHDAKARTCISRAYYHVFLQCRIYKGINYVKDKSVHEVVIGSFEKSIMEEEQEIGRRLRKLKEARNKADYDISEKIKLSEAMFWLLESGEIHKSLSVLKKIV